jgi:probable rRNA maturation factor
MKTRPGATVFVQNRVGRKGVPATSSFERWVRATLRGRHQGRRQVNIALLDESEGRDLNHRFRGKNFATNILSFACDPLPHQRPVLLGDLAICAPVVAREATEQGKPLRDHYAHLTVHGVLHLLGFDHESAADAARMEDIERRILACLHIPDPYA